MLMAIGSNQALTTQAGPMAQTVLGFKKLIKGNYMLGLLKPQTLQLIFLKRHIRY
jgi:hypothetical protein